MQIYKRLLRFQILSQKDFGNGSDTHNEWHFQNGGGGDTSTNYALWKPSAFLKVLRKVAFSLLSRQSLELLFWSQPSPYIYSANLNAKRVNYMSIESINPQIIKSRGKEQSYFTRECCNSISLKPFTSVIVKDD